MRRFFIEHVPTQDSPMCRLSKSESHHLFRVVKIAQGEKVELFDGKGGACIAILHHTRDEEALLEWVRSCEQQEPVPELYLYLSLLKQQAWATALRMVVEVGVSHIIPVLAERSIAKFEKRARWEKIILAASKQSGQARIPTLHAMMRAKDVYTAQPNLPRYILAPTAKIQNSKQQHVALWIGPEGGFSPKECQHAQEKGWIPAGLGRNILRADTAAIIAASRFLGA